MKVPENTEEMERLLKVINQCFASNDRQMNKIGQRLCHEYRISYFVFPFSGYRSGKILTVYCKYFLSSADSEYYKKFYIKLSK